MQPKRVDVNLDEIIQAMDDHTGAIGWFLDIETGEMHALSEQVLWRAEDEPDDESGSEADDAGPAEWGRQEREEARGIVADPDRFVRVPQGDSGESYRLMEDFIPQVRDGRLRERLWEAIAGKGAFRRFKDALLPHPDVRADWFAFEARVKGKWAVEWLASIGVETSRPPPGQIGNRRVD
jgi:hypothetical protein